VHSIPRVFLDTSTLKLATDRVVRGFTRQRTIAFGDSSITVPMVQFRIVSKVPRPGTEQAADTALLPFIAHLAFRQRIELLWHLDGAIEFGRLPNTDSPRGRFFGAPITWVAGPQPWGRIIADGHTSMEEHQAKFLRSLRDPRFIELQGAVGVKDGSKKAANQLLDAWHIRCAESADAMYFVTCDYKLIRHLESHKRTQPGVCVVTPRVLLTQLLRSRRLGFVDIYHFVLEKLRSRAWPVPRTGLEDLAALGEKLERQGHYDRTR